jgi:hypothetical protein
MKTPSDDDVATAVALATKFIENCDDEDVVNLSKKYNEVSHGHTNIQVDLAMARFMGTKFSYHPDPNIGLMVCNLLMQWMLEAVKMANEKEAENAVKN